MFFLTYLFVDGITLVRINESDANTNVNFFANSLDKSDIVGNISFIRVWNSHFTVRSCRMMTKVLCYVT